MAAERGVCVGGRQQVVDGDAALASAHFRDDAVGADLVAAFLYLDHRAGAEFERGRERLVFADGARGRRVSAAVLRAHERDERALVGVAHDEVYLRHGAQVVRRALGVAAGGDYERRRVAPPRRANRLPRFAVGDVSHRAGVQDVYLGALALRHDAVPGARELARERLRVRLIQLAAVSFEANARLSPIAPNGRRRDECQVGVHILPRQITLSHLVSVRRSLYDK